MNDTVERHFARNLPRLLLYLGVTATVATIALRAVRGLAISPLTAIVRIVLALVQGLGWTCFGLVLIAFGWAVMSLAMRRLFGDRSDSILGRFLAVVVVAAVLAFIAFVPMCLGSLSAGTYECITLAQRAVTLLSMMGVEV